MPDANGVRTSANNDNSFVGLTPGILVCLALGRWVGRNLGTRGAQTKLRIEGQMLRILRSAKTLIVKDLELFN